MSESLIGRTVRITGGKHSPSWAEDSEHTIIRADADGTVMADTRWGAIWIGLNGTDYTGLTGEVLPASLVGRHVRLTGKAWGEYGMPLHGSVQVITHEPGFTRWAPTLPGINPDGDEAHIFYVVLDPEGVDPSDVRAWSAELLPAQPDEPPVGSIVAAAFDDIEGNSAERASDGRWLIAGEVGLSSWDDLIGMARESITILRSGYGS